MKTTFKNRPVEIESISHDRYDSCDSFIELAYYADTDEELTDEELQELTDENQDLVYKSWFERQIDAAESAYDASRDGSY